MGVLKRVEQGWTLVRIIAQSEAVKDARDRVLNRIAEQAERISQSGLVPRVISAPAEIVAELIARRPPKPVEACAYESASPQSPCDEPRVEDPIDESAGERAPEPAQAAANDAPAPVAEAEPPRSTARAAKPANRRPKPTPSAKKPSATAAGTPTKPAGAKTSKKPKSGSKKVRDKAGDLK